MSTPRILLVGGGHAQLAVLNHWCRERPPELRATLLSPDSKTLYSGMVPGYLSGHYRREQCQLDLRALCSEAGIDFVCARACAIDPDQRQLQSDQGATLHWDWLSLDIGACSPPVGSETRTGLGVKPLNTFVRGLENMLARSRDAAKPLELCVIGGGAAGVELLVALALRCRREPGHRLVLRLLSAAPQLMPGHNDKVGAHFHTLLETLGVDVRLNTRVVDANAESLTLDDGRTLACDEVIRATGAGAPAWLQDSTLATDPEGLVRVDATLRSVSHPHIFAAGDIASYDPYPLAKSGVHAVRQGPVLAKNLVRATRAQKLLSYRPQRHFLSLILAGDQRAVASRGRLYLPGRLPWKYKDWIDRRWVASHGGGD